MSQRLLNTTKWLWCLLVLYAGPIWSPVETVTVRTPPKNPTTVEAKAKFFQDFFSVQLSPYKIEFGHVCEDPNTWEQRYEKKDFKNHRDMGKVRWGDKKGGYGEHYWDLNHAGHAGNHGQDDYGSNSDDGSYRPDDSSSYNHEPDHSSYSNDSSDDRSDDPYEEPSEESPKYEIGDYDPENASKYKGGRAKRAHPRVKIERKPQKEEETYDEQPQIKPKKQVRRNKEHIETAASQNVESATEEEDDDEIYKKPVKSKRPQQRQESEEKQEPQLQHQSRQKETTPNVEEQASQPTQYVPRKQFETHYVPYERGAGVRQHYPEATSAASAPRLFLEPSTGHVIDRATGQAYVLQPVQPIVVG